MTDNDIQRGLAAEARLIEERIPMQIDVVKAKAVAKTFREFMQDHKLTQAEMCRRLDIGSTRMSQFLQGKYKGNIEEIVNKAINFMNSQARRDRQTKGPAFVKTEVADRIRTIITHVEGFSRHEGKIGLIIGDSGQGKSRCLQQYAMANHNSIYVELDSSMTKTMVFKAIAEKLKADGWGSLSWTTQRIITALYYRQMIVILDEASSLDVSTLNLLRQIVCVKGRCPLILAGNNDLLKTINQSRVRKGCESLDQFESRLIGTLNLDKITADKDGGLHNAKDIRAMYEYGGIRLTRDAVDLAKRIAKIPHAGRLRTLDTVITALHASRQVKEVIDSALILDAIDQLDLPVREKILMLLPNIPTETEAMAKIA